MAEGVPVVLINASLTDVLAHLGYTHKKAGFGSSYHHDIFNAAGDKVFTGSADETWKWLRKKGLIDA